MKGLRWLVLLVLTASCSPEAGPDAVMERVRIPPGASFAEATDSLAAHGVVRRPTWFKLVARIRGLDRAIQAGIYEFPRGAPHALVLESLAEGRVVLFRVTVPEGLPIPDVADLVATPLEVPADSFVRAAEDTALLRALGLGGDSFEGYLFPDTYSVRAGSRARDIVRQMAQAFLDIWKPEWDARLDTLGMTRHEVVILASIVEGEVRVPSEAPVVAAVYHNRLRRGMRLQADPTVQYAIRLATGQRKSRLLLSDYRFPSRYNTYLHSGLPPGPISSPGARSLHGTLYPATVPYLFFVAQPDGRHVFSRTYREHLAAIARIRRTPSSR